MTADLGTVMNADHHAIVMTADHHATAMNVEVVEEAAGVMLPVMTEVDLNEGNLNNYFNVNVRLSIRVCVCSSVSVRPKTSSKSCSIMTKCQ